jgi:hypothetical protein
MMARTGELKRSWCNRRRGAAINSIDINKKLQCRLMTTGILKRNRMQLDISRCRHEEENLARFNTNLPLPNHTGCDLPLLYLDPKALRKGVGILPIMTVG